MENILLLVNYGLGNYLCNFMLTKETLCCTHDCHKLYTAVMYGFRKCVDTMSLLSDPDLWKILCTNTFIVATLFCILGSFVYLPLLLKSCLSGIEPGIWSNGTILCTSHTLTFLILPVGSHTSSCLEPIQAHNSEVRYILCIPVRLLVIVSNPN